MSHLEQLTARWIRSEISKLQAEQSVRWSAAVADRISALTRELKSLVSYK